MCFIYTFIACKFATNLSKSPDGHDFDGLISLFGWLLISISKSILDPNLIYAIGTNELTFIRPCNLHSCSTKKTNSCKTTTQQQ